MSYRFGFVQQPGPLGPKDLATGRLVRWLDRAPHECLVESRWDTVRNSFGVSGCARWALRLARMSIPLMRANAQLRSRPMSEKALIILECEDPFENMKSSPLNDEAHVQGPSASP
jgi:hypothetical protein